MHASSPVTCMNSEKWLPASQPFCGPRMADMARTVKMQWLPGAHGPFRRARARGSRRGHIVASPRARARQQIKISQNSGTPQCQNAVKMGGRTVVSTDTVLDNILVASSFSVLA